MIASVRCGRMIRAYTAVCHSEPRRQRGIPSASAKGVPRCARDDRPNMQLVVTIHEPTEDAAIEAIRKLREDHDMIEVRLDAFGGRNAEPFRNITKKPIIFTNRGGEPVDADFGLINVEYGRKVKYPDRTVLSFHDFEAVPDLKQLIAAMTAFGCAHTKVAVTPRTLRENEQLLAVIQPGLTMIGMGERGLYSRILAP